MDVQSLAYQTDIGIRRLAGASVEDCGEHLVVATPTNRGFWWGNFILLAAPPGAGEAERLRAMFERAFPSANHLALGVDGTGGEPGDAGVIGELGLDVETNDVLSAPELREPRPAGAGAVLRRLRDDDDWAQAVELRLEVYEESDNDEHRAFVERQLAESRELCERGDGTWFGAFADGRLVSSLGLLRALPRTGRYQTVETLAAYRRQGLGRSSALGGEPMGRERAWPAPARHLCRPGVPRAPSLRGARIRGRRGAGPAPAPTSIRGVIVGGVSARPRACVAPGEPARLPDERRRSADEPHSL